MTSKLFPTAETLLKQCANYRKRYAKLCDPQLQQFHLSPCEIDMLILLSNNPSIHNAKEIVLYLNVAKSLVARSVEALVERGFLRVEIDSKDRRMQCLYLTEEAGEIVDVILKHREAFTTDIFSGIDPQDIAIAQKVMTQINENMKQLYEGE